MLDIALAASSKFCSGLLTTIEPNQGGEPTLVLAQCSSPCSSPACVHVVRAYPPLHPSLGLLPWAPPNNLERACSKLSSSFSTT